MTLMAFLAVSKLGIKIQLDYILCRFVLLRCAGEILLPNKISTLCQTRVSEDTVIVDCQAARSATRTVEFC